MTEFDNKHIWIKNNAEFRNFSNFTKRLIIFPILTTQILLKKNSDSPWTKI